jgi:hypothetical protein
MAWHTHSTADTSLEKLTSTCLIADLYFEMQLHTGMPRHRLSNRRHIVALDNPTTFLPTDRFVGGTGAAVIRIIYFGI